MMFDKRVGLGGDEEVGEGGGLAEVFDVEGGTVVKNGELTVDFGAHGGHEQDRQLPERRHVQALIELTDIAGAVAEERGTGGISNQLFNC